MGPAEWIGSGATPMSALVLPLGVHSPLAYMGSFHLLRFLLLRLRMYLRIIYCL